MGFTARSPSTFRRSTTTSAHSCSMAPIPPLWRSRRSARSATAQHNGTRGIIREWQCEGWRGQIASQDIDLAARTATVGVTTLNADGSTAINHPFAAAAGFDVTSTTVFATATAQWARGARTLPLALDDLRVRYHRGRERSSGAGSATTPTRSARAIRRSRKFLADSAGSTSSMQMPRRRSVGCIADIDADGQVGSSPGNEGLPNDKLDDVRVCHGAFTESLAGQTVYVPLADYSNGLSGNNGQMAHREYGKFVLHAWKFSGGSGTRSPTCSSQTSLTRTVSIAQEIAEACWSNSKGTLPLAACRGTTSPPASP